MIKTLVTIACLVGGALFAAEPPVGIFETNTDIGETPLKGSSQFDAGTGTYRITGGGANIWTKVDAFQFLWKKMSGDMAVTADLKFVGVGGNAHRKAVLMIRQSLDVDSAYVDAAAHGDGMTSLQFRPATGAVNQETRSVLKGQVRFRIERRGNRFTLYSGRPGEELRPVGPVTVALQDPLYVGLGVCAHDVKVVETAVFSNVKVESLPRQAAAGGRPPVRSRISVYDLKTKSTEVIFTEDKLWEAPNWSPDGGFLMANSGGNLYRLPVRQNARPEKIDLGSIVGCNNDHGISPVSHELLNKPDLK